MKYTPLLVLFIGLVNAVFGQCPQILDGTGTASNNPYWVSCSGNNFTVFVQPTSTIGYYAINWGDGTTPDSGATLFSSSFIQHTYAATNDTFNITITDTTTGCVINGVAVLEQPVNASIQIPLGGLTQICAPGSMSFINSSTNTSPTTVYTWTWGDGTGAQVFGPSNAGTTVSHTFQKGTVSCVTTVTLTAENYCSFGNPTSASFNPVLIFDVDEALISTSATTTCYPDTTFHFANASTKNCLPQGNNAQRHEYWNFGDYWGLGYDSIINWQAFDPPTRPGFDIAYPGVGTYTVMLIDSNQCGRDTAYQTVTITNPPVAALSPNTDTICAGQTITFANLSSGGANSYRWNFGTGAGFQNLGTGNKSRTFTAAGTYTVYLVALINGATSYCRDTASVEIVVLPNPNVSFTISNNDGCDSMQVTFTNNNPQVSHAWNFGNGQTSTAANPAAINYTAAGSYTVSLTETDVNGCSASTSQVVAVHTTPTPGFSPNNVCEDFVATFTDNSTTVPGEPIVSYFWNFGDGDTSSVASPTHLYANSGNYTFVQTVSTAYCTATDSSTVVVEPKPAANFSVNDTIGCSVLTLNFTNASTGAASYSWNFGDGTTSATASPTKAYTNTATTDTTYLVRFIASTAFGCHDTLYQNITVKANPNASFTSDAVIDCAPLAVNFSDFSSNVATYAWNFGDSTGSALANPSHVFQNQTQFIKIFTTQLIVTGTNGCQDTATQTINVYPEPIFTFQTLPQQGCSPLSVSFPSVIGAVGYSWDFGDGSTSTGASPSHIYTNNTTNSQQFIATLIATSPFGCSDTNVSTVTVFPNPTAVFTANNVAGCQPLPITFQNLSTGGTNYFWSFGDGDTITSANANIAHTYTSTNSTTQAYTAKLIATTNDGCKDSMTTSIFVYPQVNAAFNVNDTIGCSPLALAFVNQSTGAANYQWSFGNGSSAITTNTTQTFTNFTLLDTTYSTRLIAISPQGCQDTIYQGITIHPKPEANFAVDTAVGCQPLAISIYNNSLLNDTNSWIFGDNTTSTSSADTLYKSYPNLSNQVLTRTINLIVETNSGCKDTATKAITIYPFISAGFNSDTIGCSPKSIFFFNQSSGASNYYWNFGDGNTAGSTNPTNLFVNQTQVDTTFSMYLTAISAYSCTDTARANITVLKKPEALFNADVVTGCSPLTVTYTNNSVSNTTNNWTFGDGTTSTDTSQLVQHTFTNFNSVPVTYTTSLVVQTADGCSDTITQSIVVYPNVSANFTTFDTVNCSPLNAVFVNQSVGATSYIWDFGDGAASSATSPSHVYQNNTLLDTIYNTYLVATNNFGCTDTAFQSFTIYALPIAQFSVNPNSGCQPLDVAITNTSSLNALNNWSFGDGTVDTTSASTLMHTYTNATNSTITRSLQLIVTSQNGCKDTATASIQVYPLIIADYLSVQTGCHPLTVNFSDNSTGATTYQWDFGDGNISGFSNPSHTFINNTLSDVVYTTTLVVSNLQGCTDTFATQITVHPKPIAAFNPSVIQGCTPLVVQHQLFAQLNTITTWVYGDNQTSNTTNNIHTHTYVNTTLAPVNFVTSLYVESSFGCKDTASQTITVYPPVNAAFFVADTVGCTPMDLNFVNQSTGAVTYSWNFDNGNFSTTQNPAQTFNNFFNVDTTYDVTLVAISQYNCTDTLHQNILVHPTPTAAFTASVVAGCSPLNVTFTNNSSLNSSNLWNFGNSNTSNSNNLFVTSTYINTSSSPQNFDVRLIAQSTNGCSDTTFQQVTAYPQVDANFVNPVAGCSPLDVQFTNTTTNGFTYNWNFAGLSSSTLSNPNYTFVNTSNPGVAQTFIVTLIATSQYNCIDSIQKSITVYPQPIASFTVLPSNTIQFPNSTVVLNNTTTPTGPWNYLWNYDDGSLDNGATPTPHTYINWGTYQVTLTVSSTNCNSTTVQTIEILPPIPVINADISFRGCEPLTIQISDSSLYVTDYYWSFGDGSTVSNAKSPNHTYTSPGTYTITLNVVGPGGDTDSRIYADSVIVYPSAKAFFDLNPTEVSVPNQAVNFYNLSSDADTFYWTFDDGGFSTDFSPVYFYKNPGEYYPTLWANNIFNCPDSFTLANPIIGSAAGKTSFPNVFTPNLSGPSGGKYDPKAEDNDIFFPITEGVVDYKLNIFNRWGELIFESNDVAIGWDGYYKNSICQQDVYIYKVSVKYSNGESEIITGEILLLK